MTTPEIVATVKELYGADVSAYLISRITGSVIEQVISLCLKFARINALSTKR